MEDAHARARGAEAREKVVPPAEVVSGPQLHELHEVVFDACGAPDAPSRAGREDIAQIGGDGDFVGIRQKGVERRAYGEIGRQGALRTAEKSAQIPQPGAGPQRRIAADPLQRKNPRSAQVGRQRILRALLVFQPEVAADDAHRPAFAEAARITRVEHHVVAARTAHELPPSRLHQIDVVETPVSRHGIVVELLLSAIGGGYLDGMPREDGHRGVAVDGVRTRREAHRRTAHGQTFGVGRGERRLLGADRGGCGEEEQDECETFHGRKYNKKDATSALRMPSSFPSGRGIPVRPAKKCAGGEEVADFIYICTNIVKRRKHEPKNQTGSGRPARLLLGLLDGPSRTVERAGHPADRSGSRTAAGERPPAHHGDVRSAPAAEPDRTGPDGRPGGRTSGRFARCRTAPLRQVRCRAANRGCANGSR